LNYEKGIPNLNAFLYFHLLEKTDQNVIGWCGYHTWYLEHDRAEIGYELFKKVKRQG
jgi:ribosomal-protein-alanine N-acetyltransferase